jgi:branched-chain amino acid transport system permease protein
MLAPISDIDEEPSFGLRSQIFRPYSVWSIVATSLGLAVVASMPLIISDSYALFVLTLSFIGAIIAVGLNITNGYLGVLNLSVAGQVAIGAYTCAIVARDGAPVPVAIITAVAIGTGVAGIAFLIFGRLRGFFFGLATISAAEIVRLLLRNVDSVTNGVRGLRGYPKLADNPATSYWIVFAILAVVVVLELVLIRSSLGLRWRAIRENQGKALSLGLPVYQLQFFGFAFSGAIMALGGALLALHLQYIDPGIAGLNTLLQSILTVTLGGVGTILGPVLGAIAITILPEFLRMANELRLLIYGAALILVVLLLPGGIVGWIGQVWDKRAHHKASNEEAEDE